MSRGFICFSSLNVLVLFVLVAFSAVPRRVIAEEKTQVVTSAKAIAMAMENNPSLRAALLAVAQADATLKAEEGSFPWVLEADTGYTHSSTPQGNSVYQQGNSVSTGVGLSKSFTTGTSVNMQLDGEWVNAEETTTATTARRYPTWGAGARLTVVQPLLRGFGNRVGEAPIRQARAEKGASEKSAQVSAGEVAESVLDQYWSLWLALRTVEINRKSRDVAQAQLDEVSERVSLGDAAMVEKLSYQTRLSSLEETVIESEAEVRRLQLALANAIGVVQGPRRILPTTSEPLPTWETVPELADIVEKAVIASPSVAAAEATVSLQEERLRVAGESERQRLDVTGWLEARTLGTNEVAPVVTDLSKGDVLAGYVGVVYELPLDKRKRDGERAVARIGVETARQTLETQKNRVVTEVATAHDDLLTAKKRIEMARETFALATAEAEAQRERYRLGAALFTTVRDAEETVREAELRLTAASVDAVKAQISIEQLTGALLNRLGKQFFF